MRLFVVLFFFLCHTAHALFNTTESFRLCAVGEPSVLLSRPAVLTSSASAYYSCYLPFGTTLSQPTVESTGRCIRVRQERDPASGLFSSFRDVCWQTSVRLCTTADLSNATSPLGLAYRNSTFARKRWCLLRNETQASWFPVHATLVNIANYWVRGCTARERLSACEGDIEACLYTCSLATSTCQYLYRCAFAGGSYSSSRIAPADYQLQLCTSAESDANCYTSAVLPRACRRATSSISWVTGDTYSFATWMCDTRPCSAAEQVAYCGHYTHRCNLRCVPGQACVQVDNCLQTRTEGPAYRCDDASLSSSCAPLLTIDDSQCRVVCDTGQEPSSNNTAGGCVSETACAGADWNRQSLVSSGACTLSEWSALCGVRYPLLTWDKSDPQADQPGSLCQTFQITRGNATFLGRQLYPATSDTVFNREKCLHTATCTLAQMKSSCLLSPFVVPLYNTRCLVTCAYLNDADCAVHGSTVSCTSSDATGVSRYADWFSTQPVRLCNDTEWRGLSCSRYRSQCRVRCRFENFTGDCVTEFKCDGTPAGVWWTNKTANYQTCSLAELATTCAATAADCRKYCVGVVCELQARCPWSQTFTNSSLWYNPAPGTCTDDESHLLCDGKDIIGGAATIWDPDVNTTHHHCAQSRCAYSSVLGYYNCSYDAESCVVQNCGPAEQLLLCGYYTLQCRMWCATSAKGATCQLVGTCGADVFLKPVRPCTRDERLTRSCATRAGDCAIQCDDAALSVNCVVSNRCFFAPTVFVTTQRYSLYRPAVFAADCVEACGDGWAVDPLRNSCYYTSCEAIVGISFFSRCVVDTNTCACPFAFSASGKRCAVSSKIYPCISATEIAAGALALPPPSVYSPPNTVLAATSWCGINGQSCLLNITGPYYKPNFATTTVSSADTCVCNAQGIPWGGLPCGGFRAPCNATEWQACGPLVQDCYRSARAVPASRSPNDTDERVVCACRTEGVRSTGLWDAQRNVPWTSAFCAANLTNLDNCTNSERIATCGSGAFQCFKPKGSSTPLVSTCRCWPNATVDIANGFGDVRCYDRSIVRGCNDTEWRSLAVPCVFGRGYCRVACSGDFNCTLDESTCYPATTATRCCEPYLAHRLCGIGASTPAEYEQHALLPAALQNLTLCRCVVSGLYRPALQKWLSTNTATATCRCTGVASSKTVDYGRVCTPSSSALRSCTQFESGCACAAQVFTPTVKQATLGPNNFTAQPWVLQADRCAALAQTSEYASGTCSLGRYISDCRSEEFAAWCPRSEHTGCLASCASNGERNAKNCFRFGECHFRANFTDRDLCTRLCGNRYAVACIVAATQTPTLGQQLSLVGTCTVNCPLGMTGQNCSIPSNPPVDCDRDTSESVCGNSTQTLSCRKLNFTGDFKCNCRDGWTQANPVYAEVKIKVLPSAKAFYAQYSDAGDGTYLVKINATAQRCTGFIRSTRNDSETALYCGAFALNCTVACIDDIYQCRRLNYTCSGRARAWSGLPCARDYDEVPVFRNNATFTSLLIEQCGNFSASAVVRLYYNDSMAIVDRQVVAGSCVCMPGYYGSRSFFCDRSFYTRDCNAQEVAAIDPAFAMQCTTPFQCQVQCYPPSNDPVTGVPRGELCYSRPEHPCLENTFTAAKISGQTAQQRCGAFVDSAVCERCRFTRDVNMRVICDGACVCACATGAQSFPGPRGLPCERDYAVLPILARTELSYFCGVKAVNGTKRCRYVGAGAPACYQAHLCQCQAGYGSGYEISPLDTDYDVPHDGVAYFSKCGLQAVATSDNITRECGPFAAEGVRVCDSRGLACTVDCSCQADSGSLGAGIDARACSGFDRNCTYDEMQTWCTQGSRPRFCRARCDVSGLRCVLVNGTCEYQPTQVQNVNGVAILRACSALEVASYCGAGGASCQVTQNGTLASGSCVCDEVTGKFDPTLRFGVICPPFQDLFKLCSTYEMATCGLVGVHACRLRHAFVAVGFDKDNQFWVDQLVVAGAPGVFNRSSPAVGTKSVFFTECLCTPYPNQQRRLFDGAYWRSEATHSRDKPLRRRLRWTPSAFETKDVSQSTDAQSDGCELNTCRLFYDFQGTVIPWSLQCHGAIDVFDSWQLYGRCYYSAAGIPCSGRGHCRVDELNQQATVRCFDSGCTAIESGFAEPSLKCLQSSIDRRNQGDKITDVDRWAALAIRGIWLQEINPWAAEGQTRDDACALADAPSTAFLLKSSAVLPPTTDSYTSRIRASSAGPPFSVTIINSFLSYNNQRETIAAARVRGYFGRQSSTGINLAFGFSEFRAGWYISRPSMAQYLLQTDAYMRSFSSPWRPFSLCRNEIFWHNVVVYASTSTVFLPGMQPADYLENCASYFYVGFDTLGGDTRSENKQNTDLLSICGVQSAPYYGVPFFVRVPAVQVFYKEGPSVVLGNADQPVPIPVDVLGIKHLAVETLDPNNYNYLFYNMPCKNNKCACDKGFEGVDCSIRSPDTTFQKGVIFYSFTTDSTGLPDGLCGTGNCCPGRRCIFPEGYDVDAQCVNGVYNWDTQLCDCTDAFTRNEGTGRCTDSRCPPNRFRPCNGHGHCVARGVCVCDRGFTGVDCSIDTSRICPPYSLAAPAPLDAPSVTACSGVGTCVESLRVSPLDIYARSMNGSGATADQVQMACQCFTSRDGHGGFRGRVCNESYYDLRATCETNGGTVQFVRLVPECSGACSFDMSNYTAGQYDIRCVCPPARTGALCERSKCPIANGKVCNGVGVCLPDADDPTGVRFSCRQPLSDRARVDGYGACLDAGRGTPVCRSFYLNALAQTPAPLVCGADGSSRFSGAACDVDLKLFCAAPGQSVLCGETRGVAYEMATCTERLNTSNGAVYYACNCDAGRAGAYCEKSPCEIYVPASERAKWTRGVCNGERCVYENGDAYCACKDAPNIGAGDRLFVGRYCQYDVTDACGVPDPLTPAIYSECFNQGTCVKGAGDVFACQCEAGITGAFCQATNCEAPCGTYGRCTQVASTLYACVCDNPAVWALNTADHGRCTKNGCRLSDVYPDDPVAAHPNEAGSSCLCDNPLMEYAKLCRSRACVSDPVSGFVCGSPHAADVVSGACRFGDRTQCDTFYKVCGADGVCQCGKGYTFNEDTGLCDQRCDPAHTTAVISTGAGVNDFACQCDARRFGSRFCDEDFCLNGGQPVGGRIGECVCVVPFAGQRCELVDCGRHGSLNATGNGCRCDDGWTGSRCDQQFACTTVVTSILKQGETQVCTDDGRWRNTPVFVTTTQRIPCSDTTIVSCGSFEAYDETLQKCACLPGYTNGTRGCEPLTCLNNGVLVPPLASGDRYFCRCRPDNFGERCQYRRCGDFGSLACIGASCQCVCIVDSGYSVDPLTGNCTKTACGVWGKLRPLSNGQRCECRAPAVYSTRYGSPLCILNCVNGIWEPRVPTFDDGDDQHCICNSGFVGVVCDVPLAQEIGDSLRVGRSYTLSNGTVRYLTSTAASAFNASSAPALSDTLVTDGKAANLTQPAVRNPAVANQALAVAANSSIVITVAGQVLPVATQAPTAANTGVCTSLDGCGVSSGELASQQNGFVAGATDYSVDFQGSALFAYPGPPAVAVDEKPNTTRQVNQTLVNTTLLLDTKGTSSDVDPGIVGAITAAVVCSVGLAVVVVLLWRRG